MTCPTSFASVGHARVRLLCPGRQRPHLLPRPDPSEKQRRTP